MSRSCPRHSKCDVFSMHVCSVESSAPRRRPQVAISFADPLPGAGGERGVSAETLFALAAFVCGLRRQAPQHGRAGRGTRSVVSKKSVVCGCVYVISYSTAIAHHIDIVHNSHTFDFPSLDFVKRSTKASLRL